MVDCDGPLHQDVPVAGVLASAGGAGRVGGPPRADILPLQPRSRCPLAVGGAEENQREETVRG